MYERSQEEYKLFLTDYKNTEEKIQTLKKELEEILKEAANKN